MSRQVIGTIRIPKGTEFRNQSSYAAWYTDGVTTEDQFVDVTLSDDGGTKWITYGYDGVATGSDYSPHFGGVQYGSNRDEEVGKPVHHTVQTYDYSFAEAVSRDMVGYRFKLAEGYSVRVKSIVKRHDGVEYASYCFCYASETIDDQVIVRDGRLIPLSELLHRS
jgi:hypothetical protein